MISLFEAFQSLKTEKDFSDFLNDLCTPSEIQSFSDRWRVAQLLFKKDLSYRSIYDKTGVSLTTITRVSRFLNDKKSNGYRSVLSHFNHA